ncbi:cytochrome c heme-binding site [Methanococcus vannielii SB]|uniref:Cytochrome c heme-binding site n=1 Tax=Methanococcus vannielii (strain ATCC 35089 / DSM 1224 / JCM 13029 / OCM 148 / SB) TaxID=406327 RepID=A6UQI4_METVS|nr:cytochrome c [Methanococcus vannielii]ABR54756.1 cytochrome c heme-binding site [Methanococcus vannielii SB]
MKISPLKTGLIGGFSAILLEVMFKVSPPPAYGLCVACHTRDLMNWIVNNLLGTNLGMAPVSKFLPVLTVIGLLIGALAGAIIHKDFKIRRTHNLVVGFILGVLVLNFALLMGGCPIRMALRAGYGDLFGLIGLVGIAIGAVVGSEVYLKKA